LINLETNNDQRFLHLLINYMMFW